MAKIETIELINKISDEKIKKIRGYIEGNSLQVLCFAKNLEEIRTEYNLTSDQICAILEYFRNQSVSP